MHEPGPISLSDQLCVITQLAEPSAPPDRSAFLAALAQLLRHEPQPLGDGAVLRAARELLATGHYRRQSTVAVGVAAPRHHLRSRLRNGTAILAQPKQVMGWP
jgi:hypothetical protein